MSIDESNPLNQELLPAVEIEPDVSARASVIWLHGLGADGYDFVPIVPELGLDAGLGVRFVFPHAPRIPVTVNMGMIMPAWYDVEALGAGAAQDLDGIRRSAAQVRALVQREIDRGIPSEKIVLAGFSQGGVIALYLGLRMDRPLAGILALSTYLADAGGLEQERHPANFKTPVFQAHGTQDPMVPVQGGERSREILTGLGYAVDWSTYPMGHAVCAEEIQAIGTWLNSVLHGE